MIIITQSSRSSLKRTCCHIPKSEFNLCYQIFVSINGQSTNTSICSQVVNNIHNIISVVYEKKSRSNIDSYQLWWISVIENCSLFTISFQATSATRIARWPKTRTKLFWKIKSCFKQLCLDGLWKPSDRLGPDVESECSNGMDSLFI